MTTQNQAPDMDAIKERQQKHRHLRREALLRGEGRGLRARADRAG